MLISADDHICPAQTDGQCWKMDSLFAVHGVWHWHYTLLLTRTHTHSTESMFQKKTSSATYLNQPFRFANIPRSRPKSRLTKTHISSLALDSLLFSSSIVWEHRTTADEACWSLMRTYPCYYFPLTAAQWRGGCDYRLTFQSQTLPRSTLMPEHVT